VASLVDAEPHTFCGRAVIDNAVDLIKTGLQAREASERCARSAS
jgi:hypothetical protein